MPFKDYIKELLDTVTDIDNVITQDSNHNLNTCGKDIVLPALVQALKLKQYVLEKAVQDSRSEQHNARKAESRKQLAAVKKRLFSLEEMVEETGENSERSLCFGDNKVNGDLNYSGDVFSDSIHAGDPRGSLKNPVNIDDDDDNDSDVTVDLDNDNNNSAEERSKTPNIDNEKSTSELQNLSGSSSGKKKYKFTPVKRDSVDGSAAIPPDLHVVSRKIVTDKDKEEDWDSDNTDDLENFDDFNLEDLSRSTPSVKTTSQKATSQEKRNSPEVLVSVA